MISPVLLKEHIMESTAEISEIQKREVLVTDDELVELLTDYKTENAIMLVAVLPSYAGFGVEDNTGIISYLQFFVLEKNSRSSFKNRDEYLSVFQRTLTAAIAFLEAMFGLEILNCSDEKLQYDFQIRPISHKAKCNGYEIQIDSKAYTDNY